MALLASGFKAMGVTVSAVLISLTFIFIHDWITQCDQFKAKRIGITGNRHVSEKEVMIQAGLQPDINIFAVNLKLVQKRLSLHPWIAAVEVHREIPATLFIHVKEQKAIAVVDLGRKYLINEKGHVFKPMAAGDPKNLTVIQGLDVSDVHIEDRRSSSLFNPSPEGYDHSTTFAAVMDIMRRGAIMGSVLPNRLIKKIDVDREIGLTVYAFQELKTIKLGYDNYAMKYDMLKKVLPFLERKKIFGQYDCIDVNSLNRIVIRREKFSNRR